MKLISDDNKDDFNFTQHFQEEEYNFPYHYLDLVSDYRKFILNIEYLSLLEYAKRIIFSLSRKSVLDVGCGDGRLCFELKNKNLEIVGIDYSYKAINFARGFSPELEFIIQDIENFDRNDKFDVIVLMETLEHFLPERIPQIINNLSKFLKIDGRLIITVPSKNTPLPRKHFQHFTRESLNDTLKPHFKINTITGYDKTFDFHRIIFRLLKFTGCLVYHFRNRFYIVRKYYKFLRSFYDKNLFLGEPDECNGLIAVCEKIV